MHSGEASARLHQGTHLRAFCPRVVCSFLWLCTAFVSYSDRLLSESERDTDPGIRRQVVAGIAIAVHIAHIGRSASMRREQPPGRTAAQYIQQTTELLSMSLLAFFHFLRVAISWCNSFIICVRLSTVTVFMQLIRRIILFCS